jgi:hypothetical protein
LNAPFSIYLFAEIYIENQEFDHEYLILTDQAPTKTFTFLSFFDPYHNNNYLFGCSLKHFGLDHDDVNARLLLLIASLLAVIGPVVHKI